MSSIYKYDSEAEHARFRSFCKSIVKSNHGVIYVVSSMEDAQLFDGPELSKATVKKEAIDFGMTEHEKMMLIDGFITGTKNENKFSDILIKKSTKYENNKDVLQLYEQLKDTDSFQSGNIRNLCVLLEETLGGINCTTK